MKQAMLINVALATSENEFPFDPEYVGFNVANFSEIN
jgi:hypothetical protein